MNDLLMLQVIDLKKKYNQRPALRGVNFSLERGEIYGLLGPNGAGKTTTIKILAGLISFDAGEILIGHDPYHRGNADMRRRIAYVPDEPFLYSKLTGEEHLHFFSDLYGVPVSRRAERFDFFFKYFEFESYRHELVENFSSGTRQKLLISQALMVEPEILLLDEPLVSIDPLVGRKFKKLLIETVERGMICVFATHILPLAQEVSNRIGVIVDGKIRAEGSVGDLISGSAGNNLEEFYFNTVLEYDRASECEDPAGG